MDRDEVERCPRCGCRADATETVTLNLTGEQKDRLARDTALLRRELRLRSDGDAVVYGVGREAMRANLGE